ncbi:precorrin-6y C5,15-methyltransferase (decarboxylating) subunit CbiE [Staphylococcus chromogenes]|nr:precorrin-6y C5,15-methyltransferase (decarboxylating) subunit CbiE [Staphylococcus chromogenes]
MTSPAQRPAEEPSAEPITHPHLSVVDSDTDPDFTVSVQYHGVYVIGINPGGFEELGATARGIMEDSDIIIGSFRQLELIPTSLTAERKTWPTPLVPAIPELLKNWRHQNIVVLASGDPMFHGIGQTLAREFGAENFRVIPAPSSVALAAAELKWPAHSTPVVSLVSDPIETLIPVIDAGQPFFVLGRDRFTPQAIGSLLVSLGQSLADVTVLSDLGGPDAQISSSKAHEVAQPNSSLNVIAVTPVPGIQRSALPGLPEELYEHDGQITKHHIRALTISALEPTPGMHLWDIGAGSGSISIEFLRSTPGTTAVAFERSDLRRARIRNNAAALGVPHLEVFETFPMHRPDRPSAVFIGGGLTAPGLFEAAWSALIDGGVLVANAVTIESQALLADLRAHYGGSLTCVSVSSEHAVGSFTAMRPALPVWQWKVRKPATD